MRHYFGHVWKSGLPCIIPIVTDCTLSDYSCFVNVDGAHLHVMLYHCRINVIWHPCWQFGSTSLDSFQVRSPTTAVLALQTVWEYYHIMTRSDWFHYCCTRIGKQFNRIIGCNSIKYLHMREWRSIKGLLCRHESIKVNHHWSPPY